MSQPLEALALLIKRAQYRNHRLLDAELVRLGISLVQWSALRQIHRNPGYSMHDLAELTFNSDQAFGALTKRLIRQDLVERRSSKGRVTAHGLTSKGETLLEQGNVLLSGVLTRAFEPLSKDEQALLAALLTKLLGDHSASSP